LRRAPVAPDLAKDALGGPCKPGRIAQCRRAHVRAQPGAQLGEAIEIAGKPGGNRDVVVRRLRDQHVQPTAVRTLAPTRGAWHSPAGVTPGPPSHTAAQVVVAPW